MPKQELTKEQEIIQALDDLKEAYLNDMKVDVKLEKLSKEKTASHYALLQAKNRLANL